MDANPFYSKMAAEPELAELVELFVRELPLRIREIKHAAAVGNCELVARLAHQLKGAGGSHGFPQIGPAAFKLEQVGRQRMPLPQILAAIEDLSAVCDRARPGVAV